MACCAAAIFIILQIVFGIQKALAFVSGGRWGTAPATAVDPAVSWRLATNAPASIEVGRSAKAFRFAGWRPNRWAVAPILLAGAGAALFVLTKPGVPSPIPQSELMALLHAKICGAPSRSGAQQDAAQEVSGQQKLSAVGRVARPAGRVDMVVAAAHGRGGPAPHL